MYLLSQRTMPDGIAPSKRKPRPFVIDGREYAVRDEHELALVLELLAQTKNAEKYHWNVLMSLDSQLL